jgi:hypothetical protein
MKALSFYLGLMTTMLATPSRAELENENLLAKLPTGFKVDYQQKNKDMLISEMVPVAQSVNNWTEMVTVQVFYNLKATPEQFKGRMDQGLAAACSGSETVPVTHGDENGYTFLLWLQNCPLNKATGKPEITWIKAIQGKDSFYVVQVAFKFMPSNEQITQWMQYLRSARVCDSRVLDRTCAGAAIFNPPASGAAR